MLSGKHVLFIAPNFFGYEKYRVDRISGFFNDDLILGSYLSRLLPLFIALIIFFKSDKKLSLISLLVFFITYILIFLTGKRASFLMASLALLIIVIQIRVFFYPKMVILIASVSVVMLFIFFNPIVFDRHFSQYKNQVVSQSQSSENIILPYYMLHFQVYSFQIHHFLLCNLLVHHQLF